MSTPHTYRCPECGRMALVAWMCSRCHWSAQDNTDRARVMLVNPQHRDTIAGTIDFDFATLANAAIDNHAARAGWKVNVVGTVALAAGMAAAVAVLAGLALPIIFGLGPHLPALTIIAALLWAGLTILFSHYLSTNRR